MKCDNCQNEINPKDRFCSYCGAPANDNGEELSKYEKEIRQFTKEQEDAKSLDRQSEHDLANPTDILKAQLRLLTSIYRKLEKLENNSNQNVKVIDFDMPFWSLVNFELKAFLVALFFMSIVGCLVFMISSSFFGATLSTLFGR